MTIDPSRRYVSLPADEATASSAGTGFMAGVAGGSIVHFFRGFRSAGLSGGFTAACANAPRVGGKLAALMGLRDAVECAVICFRRKDERFAPLRPTATFISTAVAAAAFWAPRGPRASLVAALSMGTFSGVLEANYVWTNEISPYLSQELEKE